MSNNEKQASMREKIMASFGGKSKLAKRNRKNLISMSCGTSAANCNTTMPGSYLQYFYTEFLKVPVASVSVMLSIVALIDAITDFLMGMIVDRLETRRGRIKHWFLWMAIPAAVGSFAIWLCPENWSTMGKLVYLFIIYNIYSACVTAIRQPSLVMTSMCFNDTDARQQANFIYGFLNQIVQTILGAGVAPLIVVFGSGIAAYRGVSIIICGIAGILALTAGTLCTEVIGSRAAIENVRETEGEEAAQNLILEMEVSAREAKERKKKNAVDKSTLVRDIILLLRNKYWVIKQLNGLFSAMSFGFLYGTATYFARYVLNNFAAVSGIFGSMSVGSMVGIVLAGPLFVKYDTRFVGIIGSLISIVALGLSMFGIMGMNNNLAILYIGMFIFYIGFGFTMLLDNDLLARTVDYGEWKFGIRLDGISFSGASVMQKVMQALCTAVLGFALAASGYSVGSNVVSASTITAIEHLFLTVPLLCRVLTLFTYFAFDLTNDKVKNMRREIQERAQNNAQNNG